ncbi:MAG: ubiquinol oxidase subunit II [Chlamydiales bacterium]
MKKIRIIFLALIFLAIVIFTIFYFMIHDVTLLKPDGLIGIKERNLLIDSSLIMLLIVIPTIVLCLAFAWIYRASNKKAKYTPKWAESTLAEVIWWCIPFIIVIIISVMTWKTSIELNPFRPIETDKKELTIQVVALQWKWVFLYPEEGIATVNYLQIPIETPIRFEISAEAPMNSFWIPDLGGQIYAMPAMRSILYLIANQEGDFTGYSANISGKGFAEMTFQTHATSKESFDNWVSTVQESSDSMDYSVYQELVQPTTNHPIATYHLKQKDLFDKILNQYKPLRNNEDI